MKPEDSRRLVIEGLVIVASILLAFWIDAWWDGVEEEQREATLVASVREELEDNRRTVRLYLGFGAAHLDRIDRFLRSTSEELLATPPDSVHGLVEAMWLPPTFDPRMSAAMMLLDAPPLSTSESLVLRERVGNWSRQLADAQEEGSDLRANASEVVSMLAAYSTALPPPPSDPISDWSRADLTRQNRTFVSTAVEQSGPEMLARLRADSAFVAALARKMHDQRRYIFEVARASEDLDVILAMPTVSAAR